MQVRAALADREKNHKSLVNDLGNEDSGSRGGGGRSSSGHNGNNFGICGCLTTLCAFCNNFDSFCLETHLFQN